MKRLGGKAPIVKTAIGALLVFAFFYYLWDRREELLELLEIYRRQDLVAALERAVQFGAYSLRAVERILAAQAQPKTPLEALGDQQQRHLREILQDPPVPPRPTADYEPLDDSTETPDDAPPKSEDEPKR